MVTGVSERNLLGKKKARSISEPRRTSQQQIDIEVQQLAQTAARLERQQKVNYPTFSSAENAC